MMRYRSDFSEDTKAKGWEMRRYPSPYSWKLWVGMPKNPRLTLVKSEPAGQTTCFCHVPQRCVWLYTMLMCCSPTEVLVMRLRTFLVNIQLTWLVRLSLCLVSFLLCCAPHGHRARTWELMTMTWKQTWLAWTHGLHCLHDEFLVKGLRPLMTRNHLWESQQETHEQHNMTWHDMTCSGGCMMMKSVTGLSPKYIGFGDVLGERLRSPTKQWWKLSRNFSSHDVLKVKGQRLVNSLTTVWHLRWW